MEVTITAALFLILCMIALGIYGSKRGIRSGTLKALFGANIGLFFGLMIVSTIILFSEANVSAAEAAAQAAAAAGLAADAAQIELAYLGADASRFGLAYLGAALSTGLATIGAGIAVAITGSAALGAISEDQSLLGKTLIFVGLSEGIAIYGLIVSILILGYVG